MKHSGKVVLPMKSMDRFHVVIYVGTFSKILFPGLRIGWIAADRECIDRLIPLQKTSIISGSLVDQAALCRFCRKGHYDLHVRRMRLAYKKRMQKALIAMETHLSHEYLQWTQPRGGYVVWLKLQRPCEESKIVDFLLGRGVAVLRGSYHFNSPPDGTFFRISVAHLDGPAIEEGIRRLGTAVADFCRRYS